jgi:nucleotide-binding universal stress UspA family protein
MYNFSRLLVCLDSSELDKTLIESAALYAKYGKTNAIYFVTVVKSLEMPASLGSDFLDMVTPYDEELKQKMKADIQASFKDVDCDFHFDVLVGNPTKQIINWSKAKEIDLIILGKKPRQKGGGITARNIVNLVQCSALFIPANGTIKTKNILVPVDYSEASNIAFLKGLELSRLLNVPLTCLHSFGVPSGFYKTGKTLEEFAAIIRKHSEKDFETYLKKENISSSEIKTEYIHDDKGAPSKNILEYATTHKFDLVIIGSKGRTALSSVLLGSVAVKIIESELENPVMVVKTGEANLSLIDAILQI